MKEYVTETIVLSSAPFKEHDRNAVLYTRTFGRIEVKITGGRKIISKLTPHLDILNHANVRLIKKNKFTVADAILQNRFRGTRADTRKLSAAFKMANLIKNLTPAELPDLRLWHFLLRSLKEGKFNFRDCLKVLGYNPAFASCANCGAKGIGCFSLNNQSFFCRRCGLKLHENEVIYI